MVILDAIASQTVQSLVEVYGFDLERSVEAVESLGDKSDVGLAVSWLLDHGEDDKGGAVEFVHCPHLDDEAATPLVALDALPSCNIWVSCADGCRSKENWVCLCCGVVRCSRYVSQHALEHHRQSGHTPALSLSDMSTWCFHCDAYVHHPRIEPLVKRMQVLKFGEDSAASVSSSGGACEPNAAPPEGLSERQRGKCKRPATDEALP